MLRRALTVYLLLFTAAGPALCCCAATSLFAAPPAAAHATRPQPTCCRGKATSPDAGCPKRLPGRDSRAPQPCPDCPVQHHPTLLGSVVVDASRAAELSLLRLALHATLPPAAGVLLPDPLALLRADAASPAAGPFLSAFDLLHVQHRLRC